MSTRSHLYVPANDLERLKKSIERGADALIIDLEDGVSVNDKDLARENLANWLELSSSQGQIWVRVNHEKKEIDSDLASAVHPKVTGIVFPKTANAQELTVLDQKLSVQEKKLKLSYELKVCALIESATGVFNAREIAQGPRVTRLQIGESDLCADIGTSGSGGEITVQYARSIAVFASASAGINPPVAAVSTDFTDLVAFRSSTEKFREWGYIGRACIHPAQVSIVNDVFTPTDDELERAQNILDRLSQAGGGVAVDAQGKMIDEAIARIARRILSVGD